jgi:hypothetical protein
MGVNRLGSAVGVSIRSQGLEVYLRAIERQGQYVRIIRVKKCGCVKNGQPDLFHNLCNGKGYIFDFQPDIEVVEEQSQHFSDGKVYPFYIPITKVRKVMRWIAGHQSWNRFYEVESISADKKSFKLLDDGYLPKTFEKIKVTYFYKSSEDIIDEVCDHKNGLIYTEKTQVSVEEKSSNPYEIHGNIIEVIRVYNETTSETLVVESFSKNQIKVVGTPILDPITHLPIGMDYGMVDGDVIKVTYKYVPCTKMIVNHIATQNSVQKYGEDVKIGDAKITSNSSYNMGKGDIITVMSELKKDNQPLTRGSGIFDEVPTFEVYDFEDDITDIDGVLYVKNVDFELFEFNKILWISSKKPSSGTKYTVSFLYRPSYQIYRNLPQTTSLENVRFPVSSLAKMINKFTIKDIL